MRRPYPYTGWPDAAPPCGAAGSATNHLYRLAKDLANDLFDRRFGDVDIGHRQLG